MKKYILGLVLLIAAVISTAAFAGKDCGCDKCDCGCKCECPK